MVGNDSNLQNARMGPLLVVPREENKDDDNTNESAHECDSILSALFGCQKY